MKNRKRCSALLITVLVLAALATGLFPTSATAATNYIESLAGLVIVKADWDVVDFDKNIRVLAEYGYPNAINCDFNANCYNEVHFWKKRYAPLAIGYTTTRNRHQAITGLIVTDDDGNGESPRTFDGIEYYVVGGWEDYSKPVPVAALDMNRFTKGAGVYLYYTRDPRAGAPILKIDGKLNQEYTEGWTTVLDTNGNAADLNHGANDGENTWAYMIYQRKGAALTGSALGTGSLIAIIGGAAVLAGGAVLLLTRNRKPAPAAAAAEGVTEVAQNKEEF